MDKLIYTVIINKTVKNIPQIISFSVFLLLMSISCGILTETRAPKTFPNTDIVFSAPDGIGFVNADGSNLSSLAFVAEISYGKENQAWRPVITADGQTIIVKVVDLFAFSVSAPNALVVWRANETPTFCDNWLHQKTPLITKDQKHIFIQIEGDLHVYSLSSCGTQDAPTEIHKETTGVFSPDLRYISYVRQPDKWSKSYVVVKEVNSAIEFIVGEGDFPSWSFDSKHIAYTGADGIYIAKIEEIEKPNLVLRYLNPFSSVRELYKTGGPHQIPPEPSWSPDGKWLVYHKWTGENSDNTSSPRFNNSIYKLNIETGEEIKIVDGGMYPYWKWPAVSTP